MIISGLIEHLGELSPGLGTHKRVSLVVEGELSEEGFSRGCILETAQQTAFEKGSFQIIRIGAETIFDKRMSF